MKTLATFISAAALTVASASVSAWGWGPFGNGYNGSNDGYGDGDFDGGFSMNFSGHGSGRGNGRGYGRGYGYDAPYGYGHAPYGAGPYGYGVPVNPAVELTDEQKQAIADQQAKAAEHFQAMQKQAAEFYANNPHPLHEMERSMMEEHDTHMKEMNERMQASMKAAEERRKAADERFKTRMQERNARFATEAGV